MLQVTKIVILVHKPTKIWHFDPILRHLLCLDQKCITIETRNLKLGKIRRFPLIIGLRYMLQIFQKLKSL